MRFIEKIKQRLLYTLSLSAVLILWLPSCANQGTIKADGETQTSEQAKAETDSFNAETLYRLLVGELAGHQGDMDTALDYYLPATEASDDPRVAARAARIALYAKNNAAALKASKRWYELEPDSMQAIQSVAVAYLRLGQAEPATEYVQKLIDRIQAQGQVNNEQVFAAVAKLLHTEAETTDSISIFHELTRHYSDSPHVYLWLARFAVQSSQYDVALEALNNTLRHDATQTEAYVLKGRILSLQGKRQQALVALELAIKGRPDDFPLRLQYARLLIQENRLVDARHEFETLHATKSDDIDVLISLGLLVLEAGEFDKAIGLFTQLLSQEDSQNEGHYYLGRVFEKQGSVEAALEKYKRVAGGNQYFDAQLRIAELMARLGDIDSAVKQLQVLALDQEQLENRVRVYLVHGKMLRDVGNALAAMAIYSSALKEVPDSVDLLYARALTAEELNMVDRAIEDLKAVLQQEPDNIHALNALGYTLADRTDRFKEALKYIEQAMSLEPDDPAILDSMGWVQYRLGQFDDSVKWLRQAFEKHKDPEIAAHLGEVLWQMGEHDEAKKIWQQGKELDAKHRVLLETLKRFEQ